MQEIKFMQKQLKYYTYFCQILGIQKEGNDQWDKIFRVRLHQTSLSYIKIITIFPNKFECQS